MVCNSCKCRYHEACDNVDKMTENFCDCQHREGINRDED